MTARVLQPGSFSVLPHPPPLTLCWCLQPVHHWHDEPGDMFHYQPSAAPQLPVGSVCEPHGASEGIPAPLSTP